MPIEVIYLIFVLQRVHQSPYGYVLLFYISIANVTKFISGKSCLLLTSVFYTKAVELQISLIFDKLVVDQIVRQAILNIKINCLT